MPDNYATPLAIAGTGAGILGGGALLNRKYGPKLLSTLDEIASASKSMRGAAEGIDTDAVNRAASSLESAGGHVSNASRNVNRLDVDAMNEAASRMEEAGSAVTGAAKNPLSGVRDKARSMLKRGSLEEICSDNCMKKTAGDEFREILDSLEKNSSSRAQAAMADEAMGLLRKQFPDMSIGEAATRATRMGREGKPSLYRRLSNVVGQDYGGAPLKTPKMGKEKTLGELKRTTPGRYDPKTDVVKNPDVFNEAKGKRATLGEKIKANLKRGEAPEALRGVSAL